MSRALHTRIARLELASRIQTGPVFVVSSIPLPNDPEDQARAIEDALSRGDAIRRGNAILPVHEMTPAEWESRFSPLVALQ